jgi:hypothetical protein
MRDKLADLLGILTGAEGDAFVSGLGSLHARLPPPGGIVVSAPGFPQSLCAAVVQACGQPRQRPLPTATCIVLMISCAVAWQFSTAGVEDAAQSLWTRCLSA